MVNDSHQQEVDRLLQKEWRETFIPKLREQQWITVYEEDVSTENTSLGLRSAFIPNSKVDEILASPGWGAAIHVLDQSYMETLAQSADRWADDLEDLDIPYQRFGNDDGMEPLVIVRNYPGNLPQELEILEEFRLFHNLRFDSANSTCVKFDECGEESEVLRLFDQRVEIRRVELQQFLTERGLSLIVYFDRNIRSGLRIDNFGEHQLRQTIREKDYVCRFVMRESHNPIQKGCRSVSRLLGKVVIHGVASRMASEGRREYVEFIIGSDGNDRSIRHTCNPKIIDSLSSADSTPSAHFLTPVFFRRKVLNKYINEESKYNVGESSIRRNQRWSMDISSNNKENVIVYLGDLGNLPYREQLYWRSFNIVPDGEMSNADYRRTILGEFTEPEDSSWRLKNAYLKLRGSWLDHFGWALFKPLADADLYHFKTLHRPATREPFELDKIAVSLSKLLVEAINTEKLKEIITSMRRNKNRSMPKNEFALLREYLSLHGCAGGEVHIDYLEKVQLLRSASASHRQDNRPADIKALNQFFSLDSKSPTQVADDIFTKLTEFLDSLYDHFCSDETDKPTPPNPDRRE